MTWEIVLAATGSALVGLATGFSIGCLWRDHQAFQARLRRNLEVADAPK